MTDKRVENIISMSMPQIRPDTELNQRIMDEMDAKKGNRFHMKKAMVLAIACCLMLSSITAVAATIYYYTSVITGNYSTKDYRKIDYAEEKIGSEIKFIQDFACGFSFDGMSIRDETLEGREENGDVVYRSDFSRSLINYSRNGGQVFLHCWMVDGEQIDANDRNVRNIAGLNVKYETVKIEDTELSYNIASWSQDGVYYDLFASSDSATEEELLSMVEELIMSE